MQRVLADPRVQIYDCGRQDIKAGAIDRRVLATIEFLVASRLQPDDHVAQLRPLLPDHLGQRLRAHRRHRGRHRRRQRHPDPRQPGQGLDHRTRDPAAADPAGHDEAASDHLADGLPAAPTTRSSCADHDDHIHVGFTPQYGTNTKLAKQLSAVLKPSQWSRLIDRLGEIENPTVRVAPSKAALKAKTSRKGP